MFGVWFIDDLVQWAANIFAEATAKIFAFVLGLVVDQVLNPTLVSLLS